MATEKKLKDPAEAALSAIEQALNLDALTPNGLEGRAEPRLPDVGDTDPLLDGGLDAAGRTMPPRLDLDPPLASDLPPPGLERPRREGGLLPPDRSLVANDDRRNIGILQQTLRVRSSPKPYLFALAAGLAWIGALVLIAWTKSEGDLRGVVAGLTALQASVGAAALFQAEHRAVEVAGGVQVVDGHGEVEAGERGHDPASAPPCGMFMPSSRMANAASMASDSVV